MRERLFLAEGVRVVEELLASPIVPRFAVVSSSIVDTERGVALREALDGRTELFEVTDGHLRRLAATETPQGVLVVAEEPSAELGSFEPEPRSTLLVLDAVQDPGNFGTLARTAAALGVGAVVTLPGTVDPWNPKSVRAAAGATFRLPVLGADWPMLSRWLRDAGYVVYASDAGGADVAGLERGERAALVVGNEGAGVSPEVAAGCDVVVAVPIRGAVESLNVAAATAILLWELTR